MTESASDNSPPSPDHHTSRLQLIWDVILFQFKLAADGLRDLILVPVSIAAGILGLVAGGDDPHVYFRRVLRFGRRSEIWINLFGRRRSGTSDEMVGPLRERVFTEAVRNPWVNEAGTRLNRKLDEWIGSEHERRTCRSARKTRDFPGE